MNTPDHRYLIDASIYIFRAYFSLPEDWHSPDGYPVNAVYGYTRFLIDFLTTHQVNHVAAAFDESLGTGFRHALYPGYKASRELPDEALAYQLEACRQVTELLGISCFASEEFEADDLIASQVAIARRAGQPSCIVTRDKDLGQLLGSDDVWWDYASRQQYGPREFREKFGVRPDQFADYLALVGDAVDDIPGVPGVGPKTAVQILAHFDDLDALYNDCDAVAELPIRGAAKIADKIAAHEDEVRLYRQLTALVETIELHEHCQLRVEENDIESLVAYLEDIGLGGLRIYCKRLHQLLPGAAQ